MTDTACIHGAIVLSDERGVPPFVEPEIPGALVARFCDRSGKVPERAEKVLVGSKPCECIPGCIRDTRVKIVGGGVEDLGCSVLVKECVEDFTGVHDRDDIGE